MPIAGFRRATSGGACAFCKMLASRGAVYSRRSADFPAHDGCACSPEPVWRREEEPLEVLALRQLWDEATAGLSGRDALNAFRRALAEGKPVGLPAPPRLVDVPQWRSGLAERQAALERIVAGKQTGIRPLGHGEMGDASLVSYGDVQVVRKTLDRGRDIRDLAESADAEELAPLVAQAVGVPAPAVVRQPGAQVIDMEFVEGKLGAEIVPWGQSPSDRAGLVDSDGGRLLGLLDALMVNGDRNVGNWILNAAGEFVAIDHGMAFDDNDDAAMRYHILANNFSSHFVKQQTRGPDAWAPSNDMHPDDMAEVRRRLLGLRGDFERVGRLKWFDAMIRRVDILASAASGSRRRLT